MCVYKHFLLSPIFLRGLFSRAVQTQQKCKDSFKLKHLPSSVSQIKSSMCVLRSKENYEKRRRGGLSDFSPFSQIVFKPVHLLFSKKSLFNVTYRLNNEKEKKNKSSRRGGGKGGAQGQNTHAGFTSES